MNQWVDTLGQLPPEVHLKEEERMWIQVAQNDNQTQNLEAQAQWWVGTEIKVKGQTIVVTGQSVAESEVIRIHMKNGWS